MAQQPKGGFRRFLATPAGRILLILFAVLVVFASYAYISVIIAIPALLIFGMAIPIWVGLKRPRYLALAGLVIILTVAPVTTAVITQEVQAPVGVSNSASGAPFSTGPPLMQNASVSPFTGTTTTNFTWTVTVYPANHPAGNTTPTELDLFISTCPGATGNSSPSCAQPYPFSELENKTLPPNATAPYTVTFHYRIGSNGIWAWQMGIWTENTTNKSYRLFQLLVGDPTYNGIEGPVIGGFGTIFLELLPSLYFQDFLFLGAPFYCILLVYMLFKNRERRRKEAQQRAMGPVPPTGPAPTGPPETGATPLPSSKGPPSAGAASASTVEELNCPKCNAVVYAGETTCWKCGAALPGATKPT